METTDTARRGNEDETNEECLAVTLAPKTGGKPLVLLQVNCSSIYDKTLDFGNSIDTYNPDVTGTESWLSEKISKAEVFRTNFTIFRRDRHTRGGGVFVCVKKNITCAELWFDEVYEMIVVEVKCREPKN